MDEMSESGPMAASKPAGGRRRWGLVAVGIVGAGVLVHTVLWVVVTGRMLEAVPQAVAAAAAEGWRVEAGAARRSGWPFRAAVVLDGVVATRQVGGTRLRWTAEAVEVGIRVSAPTVAVVSPVGAQTVAVGEGPPVALRAGEMAVRVPLRGGPVVLVARDAVLDWPGAGTGPGNRWGVTVGSAEVRWDGQAFTAEAGGIVPKPGLAAPFDGAATLAVHAVLTQPFPLVEPGQAQSPGAAVQAWRQSGGRLEVRSFQVRLAALSAEGSGEGGLDGRLQPEGRATLRVTGAAEVLEAAAAAGLVAPGPASGARAVLQLLTVAARGGPVAVPLELRDGILTVVRFPVLRTPVLDWPEMH